MAIDKEKRSIGILVVLFTCAGLNPLGPRVFEISVAVFTTLVEPSTATGAAAELTRLVHTAFGASWRI